MHSFPQERGECEQTIKKRGVTQELSCPRAKGGPSPTNRVPARAARVGWSIGRAQPCPLSHLQELEPLLTRGANAPAFFGALSFQRMRNATRSFFIILRAASNSPSPLL